MEIKNIKILGVEFRISELFKASRSFYAFVFILIGLFLLGLYAWSIQLKYGLVVTGTRNVVPWGLYVMNFIFFVGLAAGGLIVVSSVELFGVKKLAPLLKVGVIEAGTCVFLAMLFIIADMGHPERAFWFLLTPNPISPLTYDFYILGIYLTICIIDAYALFSGKAKWMFPLSIVSLPAAIGIHSITAWVFGTVKSRPAWHSPIMAPIFISSAITSALGLIILLALLLPKVTKLKFDKEVIITLRRILTVAVPIDVFFLFNEILIATLPTSALPEQNIAFLFILVERYAPVFWAETLIAAVIPMIIFLHPRTKNSIPAIAIASFMVVVGIFMKRVYIIIVGMSYSPLGELVYYAPTIIEIIVMAGWIALGALIFTLAIKILPMEPISEGH